MLKVNKSIQPNTLPAVNTMTMKINNELDSFVPLKLQKLLLQFIITGCWSSMALKTGSLFSQKVTKYLHLPMC